VVDGGGGGDDDDDETPVGLSIIITRGV